MSSEESLIIFGRQWDEAIVSNDVEAISAFMSDDWIIVGTGSGVTTKQAFLEWISSGDVTHDRMESEEMRIKIYGDTGVVTSRGTSAGKYRGKPFKLFEWSTSVFIRKEGKWICVLTMITPADESGY
jgi:ketosteroid isomerase-like protein